VSWLKWFSRLFAACPAGPAATSPNCSLPSKTSSTPAPSITPKSPQEKLIEIAGREVGKKETAGSNRGPDVRKYQAATTLEPGAWPWCAAFVCWCIQQWLADPEVKAWLNLKTTTTANWRPKTALAFGLMKWAQARPATVTVLPDTAEPQAGDIVVFDFSHCGIVKGLAGGTMLTIEGNTNGAGSREGDGVYVKTRIRNLARAFIRIRPSGS